MTKWEDSDDERDRAAQKKQIRDLDGGEGNGNPLQCSCLENPRDRGAWGAAVSGAAESDTTEAT